VSNLFEDSIAPLETDPNAPLADRMRPREFGEFVGQEELVGENRPLRKMVEQGQLPSMILWGPPGSGKTTLARILARSTGQLFISLSAVTSTVADVRRVVEEAKNARHIHDKGTILFIDELHRFNKAQQDAFLPHVERGVVTLIGATTENPSFEIVGPLLSRCRVFVLNPLSRDDIRTIVERTLSDKERGLRGSVKLDRDAWDFLLEFADGDARSALNLLEMASLAASQKGRVRKIDAGLLMQAAQKRTSHYDKNGEWHHNIISALHKSLRGSDPGACLYWLARMLEAGEDPLYVARRLIRAASEDVGNADPNALGVAVNAYNACHYLGMPECNLALAQAVIYLATAPKSNSTYAAYLEAAETAKKCGDLPVPFHIRNAPTGLMKELGYGRDYKYPHDTREHYVPEDYLPEQLKGKKFYSPGQFGFEREIAKRLEYWENLRKKLGDRKAD
jgi:putative ATPase